MTLIIQDSLAKDLRYVNKSSVFNKKIFFYDSQLEIILN